ncbi:MAG: YqhA family protein [Bacteroidota bacterium]
MKVQNAFGWLLKGFAFLMVLAIVALAICICFYSMYKIMAVIELIISGIPEEGEVILKSLKVLDAALLGVIFLLIGLGLFELFVAPIENLPKWYQIKNLDELKTKLLKMIIIVMGVSFTGRVVTWTGETNLLNYGVGMGVVILALSYFLSVKMQE